MSGAGLNSQVHLRQQDQLPEYTLPGVMRFLQTEWQKNERDRMQWEIERGEMKARIARLEGEKRGNDRLIDAFTKRIRMLEKSLAEERAKSSGNPANIEECSTDLKENLRGLDDDAFKSHLTENSVATKAKIAEIQNSRQKSRQFLEKCLQEATYLLVFANSIPGPTSDSVEFVPPQTHNPAEPQQKPQHRSQRVNGSSENNHSAAEFNRRSNSGNNSSTFNIIESGVESVRGRIVVEDDNNANEAAAKSEGHHDDSRIAPVLNISEGEAIQLSANDRTIVSSNPVDENDTWDYDDRPKIEPVPVE
ncbi:Striatin family-domain-containing protein [Lipomyces japonicus]|uniref:Striatin family-domain-containing protein n=1 Tax=Lipomyces japonicus TaxID=56871 RepID=UPI0034CEDE3E